VWGGKRVREVNSDNPIQKIWQTILRFTYVDVINNWWISHGETKDDALAFFIASSFQQAKSYFDSASNANNNILPVLLYYGSVNLLVGTLTLKKHKKFDITSHGMKLDKKSLIGSKIFSTKLKPQDKSGTLNVIASEMEGISNFMNLGSWNLEELLSSLPDLALAFQFIFPEKELKVIKVEEVNLEGRLLERIPIASVTEGEKIAQSLELNTNFSDTYLKPQITQNHKYLILNRKPKSEPFGIYSISGEKYLPIPFKSKGNKFLPQYLSIIMGLFILATLSRYYPEIWDSFMRYDSTGAKNLVIEFLQKAERFFPNLILNIIEGERINFIK